MFSRFCYFAKRDMGALDQDFIPIYRLLMSFLSEGHAPLSALNHVFATRSDDLGEDHCKSSTFAH